MNLEDAQILAAFLPGHLAPKLNEAFPHLDWSLEDHRLTVTLRTISPPAPVTLTGGQTVDLSWDVPKTAGTQHAIDNFRQALVRVQAGLCAAGGGGATYRNPLVPTTGDNVNIWDTIFNPPKASDHGRVVIVGKYPTQDDGA